MTYLKRINTINPIEVNWKRINGMKLLIIVASVTLFIACQGTNCDQLPKTYSSYEEAKSIIEKALFQVEESVKTSKSKWIREASYYSCDGISGYFILKTDHQDYIYSNLPINVWQEFKHAESFGHYYNLNIKHKYEFKLMQ